MNEEKVNRIMSWVKDELPLSMEHETDARSTWPKRWELLRRKLHLVDSEEMKEGN